MWAGCASEEDSKDHQAQWQSLLPANFIREDGSGRVAGLGWAVVAERSSIFFPLVPCNKSSFFKGRLHLRKHMFQHPAWKSPLLFESCAQLPAFSRNCRRQCCTRDPSPAPEDRGPCIQATVCCLLAPGVRPRMALQHQLRDHVIEGQRLVS